VESAPLIGKANQTPRNTSLVWSTIVELEKSSKFRMGKGTYNINLFDLRIGKIAMENANGTCSICCFPMKWSVRFCMKEKREE